MLSFLKRKRTFDEDRSAMRDQLHRASTTTSTGETHDLLTSFSHFETVSMRSMKEITDAMLAELFDSNSFITSLDLTGCTSITVEGLLLILERLNRLHTLNLTRCLHLFSAWKALKNERVDKRTITEQQQALKLMATHTSLNSINLSGFMFLPKEGLRILAENKNWLELTLNGCKVGDEEIELFCEHSPNILAMRLDGCADITDTGILSLSRLEFIAVLSLRFCKKLTSQSAKLLGGVQSLIQLSLGGCTGVESEFNSFASHPNMAYLDVSSCRITDTELSIFSSIRGLNALVINGCKEVTENGLNELAEVCETDHMHLLELHMTGCIGVTEFACLKHCTFLTNLNLSLCRDISANDIKQIASSVKQLHTLNLTHCASVSSETIIEFSHINSLEMIYLRGCTGVDNEAIRALARNRHIEYVDLDERNHFLTADCFAGLDDEFFNTSIVQTLVMSTGGVLDLTDCCNLQDLFGCELAKLHTLKHLTLDGCSRIADNTIRELSRNKAIIYVSVRGTAVTKDAFKGADFAMNTNVLSGVISWIGELDFSGNLSVDDRTVSILCNEPKLVSISLQDCQNITDYSVAYLAQSETLESINFIGTSISTHAARFLVELFYAHSISMEPSEAVLHAFVKATDGIVDLGGLTADQCSTDVFPAVLETIANDNLRELGLSGLSFVDGDYLVEVLEVATELRSLVISGCTQLEDSHILDILQTHALESLDLSGIPGLSGLSMSILVVYPTLESIKIQGVRINPETIEEAAREPFPLNFNVIHAIAETSLSLSLRGHAALRDADIIRLASSESLVQLLLDGCSFISNEFVMALAENFALESVSLKDTSVTHDCFIGCERRTLNPAVVDAIVSACGMIDLTGCRNLHDGAVLAFADNSNLLEVRLDGCAELTDRSIRQLIYNPALRRASFLGTQVSQKCTVGIESIQSFAAMNAIVCATQGIDLQGARAGKDEIVAVLSENPKLLDVCLAGCFGVTDSSLRHISVSSVNIETLDVSYNDNITDAGIEALLSCPSLTKLDISGCTRLTRKSIFILGDMRKLRTLTLRDVPAVHKSIFARSETLASHLLIAVADALGELDFTGNANVNTEALCVLRGNRNIERLSLKRCRNVNDSTIEAIAELPNLRSLDVSNCPKVSCVNDLLILPLVELFLNGCWRIDDSSVAAIAGMPWLESVDVGRSTMTQQGLLSLITGRKLRVIRMSGCGCLSETSARLIAQLPYLRELDVSFCTSVNAHIVSQLAYSRTLEVLSMTNCRGVDDEAVAEISAEMPLRRLDLSYCPITYVTLNQLSGVCPNLVELGIRGYKMDAASVRFLKSSKIQNIDLSGSESLSNTDLSLLAKNGGIISILTDNCPNISTPFSEIPSAVSVRRAELSASRDASETEEQATKQMRMRASADARIISDIVTENDKKLRKKDREQEMEMEEVQKMMLEDDRAFRLMELEMMGQYWIDGGNDSKNEENVTMGEIPPPRRRKRRIGEHLQKNNDENRNEVKEAENPGIQDDIVAVYELEGAINERESIMADLAAESFFFNSTSESPSASMDDVHSIGYDMEASNSEEYTRIHLPLEENGSGGLLDFVNELERVQIEDLIEEYLVHDEAEEFSRKVVDDIEDRENLETGAESGAIDDRIRGEEDALNGNTDSVKAVSEDKEVQEKELEEENDIEKEESSEAVASFGDSLTDSVERNNTELAPITSSETLETILSASNAETDIIDKEEAETEAEAEAVELEREEERIRKEKKEREKKEKQERKEKEKREKKERKERTRKEKKEKERRERIEREERKEKEKKEREERHRKEIEEKEKKEQEERERIEKELKEKKEREENEKKEKERLEKKQREEKERKEKEKREMEEKERLEKEKREKEEKEKKEKEEKEKREREEKERLEKEKKDKGKAKTVSSASASSTDKIRHVESAAKAKDGEAKAASTGKAMANSQTTNTRKKTTPYSARGAPSTQRRTRTMGNTDPGGGTNEQNELFSMFARRKAHVDKQCEEAEEKRKKMRGDSGSVNHPGTRSAPKIPQRSSSLRKR